MMRFGYAFVAAFLWAAPLAAQTITVRSGEHETFTRLTLNVPPGIQWELTPRPGGMVLSLKMDSAFLDTSNVFSRIRKNRLREIHVRGPVLDLSLACECNVTASLAQDRILIVDIADPVGAENNSPEPSGNTASVVKDAEARRETSNTQFGYGELLWRDQATAQAQVSPIAEPSETEPEAVHPSDRSSSGGNASAYVRQAETELLTRIAKAATNGLLDPNLKIDKADEGHAESDTVDPHGALSVTGRDPFDQRENVRVRTGMFETPHTATESAMTEQGYVCPDPELIAIQNWGDDSGFAPQVGLWRSKLMGEFDHVDRNAVVGLARTYLYFGFGAEARSVLALDDEVVSQSGLLELLADILDLGYGEADNMLLPYIGCDSAFAFWGLMAHQSLPVSAVANTDAALLAFNHLPVHLREYLGPILSNRLLEHGDAEAASGVLRIVNRALQDPLVDVTMAEANLAIENGNLHRAQQQLATVVESNSPMSPVALIKLVDAKLSANEPISAETATLAAAYAHEQRDTELGPDLRRVHVLARSRSNQFDAAFDALNRLRNRDGSASSSKLRSQVLGIMTQNAGDITFMRFALLHTQIDIPGLDGEVANSMADRLLSIGFPDLATSLISNPAQGPTDRTRRVLRARIALASNSPRRAEAELIGLNGVDIDHLVAQARTMMGDHAAAIRMFDSMRSTDEALRAAWLSEDWGRLAESEDPLYTQIAGLMEQRTAGETPETDPATNLGVLAKNQVLLDQSAAARSVLAALLETYSTDGMEAR